MRENEIFRYDRPNHLRKIPVTRLRGLCEGSLTATVDNQALMVKGVVDNSWKSLK
jgi:hypothetical protein